MSQMSLQYQLYFQYGSMHISRGFEDAKQFNMLSMQIRDTAKSIGIFEQINTIKKTWISAFLRG